MWAKYMIIENRKQKRKMNLIKLKVYSTVTFLGVNELFFYVRFSNYSILLHRVLS